MSQYYLLYNKNETESEKSEKDLQSLQIKLNDIDALWCTLLKFVDAQDIKVSLFVSQFLAMMI